MSFLNGSEPPVRFSDRKAENYAAGDVWSFDDLIEAQRMACAGATDEEIGAALGRSPSDVHDKLAGPEGHLTTPRQPKRQERANIGFADLKRFR